MKEKIKGKLKKTLKNNELSIGSWITLAHPAIPEIMSASGFDWLVIDLEHSSLSLRDMEDMIRVIELSNTTPLVRLSNNDSTQIKRAMDSGSHGVLVPMVKTKKDAINAIKAVKYHPKGNRGVGLARAQGYGNNFDSYFNSSNNNSIVIVQIEHIDAIKNLEEIIKLDDIDGIILGPYDLSCSLGIAGEFEHKLMKNAISEALSISNKYNKPAGFHAVEPNIDDVEKLINQGFKFIAYSLDIRMLETECTKIIKSLNHRKNK